MSEEALPTSIITGTESDQDKEWETFKESLISSGCRKESVLLDDPFFQLWIRSVVTSPSIFAANGMICTYNDIDSQDAQQVALQTMLKVKLDSLWCHDKDKWVEAYLLLMYAHSIAPSFTMDDWADKMEVDDGTAHTLEKDWWVSQLEDLPQALDSEENHSNDVLSPDVSKYDKLLKRKKEFLANTENKQPRSILNNIAPIAGPNPTLKANPEVQGTIAGFTPIIGGDQSVQVSHSPKSVTIKSNFAAITDRNLQNLFASKLISKLIPQFQHHFLEIALSRPIFPEQVLHTTL